MPLKQHIASYIHMYSDTYIYFYFLRVLCILYNSSFNLKDFHSVCLNSGPVPLYVLEMLVDDYVSSVKSSTSEVGVLV